MCGIGRGMKLHPRLEIVQRAGHDLSTAIANMVQKYDLTWGELFGLLAGVMSRWAKYQIKEERHPFDIDRKGDEA